MELISIIIPVYKVEKYFNKCVESVVNQTYKNLEIILVDDGSPDNCPNMCEAWAKKDSRIKVIHRKNGGLSAARNSGIEVAKGEYFCFVDSDDYVAEDYVKSLYEALKSDNADMAICEVTEVDEKYRTIDDTNSRQRLSNETKTGLELLDLILPAKTYAYVVAWNKLYKRELFNNLRYAEGKIHEDEFIIHRLFARCNRVAIIDKPLYYYLKRGDSIIGIGFNIKRMDAVEALEDRLTLCKEINQPKLARKALYVLLTTVAYYTELLDVATNISSDKKQELRNKFKKIYKTYLKEILNSKDFSFPEKLLVSLYSISPALYKCYIKFARLRKRLKEGKKNSLKGKYYK